MSLIPQRILFQDLVARIMANLSGDLSQEDLLVLTDIQFLRATPVNTEGNSAGFAFGA